MQTRCNVGSCTGGTISSSANGITCLSSEKDFQISQRNKRFWIMVSKRKGYITYLPTHVQIGKISLITDEALVSLSTDLHEEAP
jgi:hypothetical protein